MSEFQENFFKSVIIVGSAVAIWLTVLCIRNASEVQEVVCEEATVLLSEERNILSCPGGKVGHENTSQGILLTCTCPTKEKNP